MATQDFKRKLTAILSADVKGYSRLMSDDEEATVRTITAYREVIGSGVQKNRGRVVRLSRRQYTVRICQCSGCGAECCGDPRRTQE